LGKKGEEEKDIGTLAGGGKKRIGNPGKTGEGKKKKGKKKGGLKRSQGGGVSRRDRGEGETDPTEKKGKP